MTQYLRDGVFLFIVVIAYGLNFLEAHTNGLLRMTCYSVGFSSGDTSFNADLLSNGFTLCPLGSVVMGSLINGFVSVGWAWRHLSFFLFVNLFYRDGWNKYVNGI